MIHAILMNSFIKMGYDFIFNAAPFLDWWDNTDGAMTEMVGKNVLGLMENFGVVLCVQ